MSDTAARLLTTFCTTFFLFHIGSKSSCLDNMKREIAYICELVKLNENNETKNHNSWWYSMKTSLWDENLQSSEHNMFTKSTNWSRVLIGALPRSYKLLEYTRQFLPAKHLAT